MYPNEQESGPVPQQPEPDSKLDAAQEPTSEDLSKQQLEEATREREQFRAMAQRAQADLINYRRRMEEERQMVGQHAASQVIVRLIPVLDDFQRAMAHLPSDAPPTWVDGVRMILRKLQLLLDAEGVTPFSPEPGAAFDPSEHEAVYFERSNKHQVGAVVSTARPGYRNANRVLRPAQVVVAQEEERQSS
jgi:molecular chaperone GrpE